MKSDKIFKGLLYAAGLFMALLVFFAFLSLVQKSMSSIKAFGFNFLINPDWNPPLRKFGALAFFVGTLLTSILALLISIPFSIAISLFLGEYYRNNFFGKILDYTTDLLAGIPSVIYGLWGLFFMVPIVRKIELLVGVPPYGVGIFTASLILTIMIIPYTSSIGREVIRLVPKDLKEAAYSLGATQFEVVKKVILPYAKSGIFAGILLSFGRALGETMAVTMVIGNSNYLPSDVFAPANTMASVIANEFAEATDALHLSSLIELALFLFVISFVINYFGNIVIKRFRVNG